MNASLRIPSSLRRIVRNLDAVRAADVVIAVSGMDGGIASVVAGIVDSPVVRWSESLGGRGS